MSDIPHLPQSTAVCDDLVASSIQQFHYAPTSTLVCEYNESTLVGHGAISVRGQLHHAVVINCISRETNTTSVCEDILNNRYNKCKILMDIEQQIQQLQDTNGY